MALVKNNVYKDKSLILQEVVKDIYIETNANLYSQDPDYAFFKNAGYVEDGSIKVTAEPQLIDLQDGSQLSKGFLVKGELTSLQYYSLFQYEKFNNKVCTIKLDGIGTFLKDIRVFLKLDANFNSKGEAKVVLSFQKKVKSLMDLITPNPWFPNEPLTWQGNWATDTSVDPTPDPVTTEMYPGSGGEAIGADYLAGLYND